jgi:hypothetical protein
MIDSRRLPRLLPIVLAPSLAFAATGCAFFRSLQGLNTVNLQGAEVVKMGVDIRKDQKTICPREKTQMAVFLDAKLKGQSETKSFETWAGPPGTSRNGKLDFNEFAFNSALGSFDADGFFTPSPDVRASVGKEFVIKAVYRARPDKFSFDLSFKPDYGCIQAATFAGNAGPTGQTGGSGSPGETGRYGGKDPGGRGGPGGSGSSGGQGGDGGDGPRLQAFVTFVKTPYYPKLLAVRIRGERDDLLLAPPDRPFVIEATGGRGGAGGNGGPGGGGGDGGAGTPGGEGGNGGNGGDGGNGGRGGHGGDVQIFYDASFPELLDLVKANVAGGGAGQPGGGGSAGNKGNGGAGTGTGAASKPGASGSAGAAGRAGAAGSPGPAGRSDSRAGDVVSQVAFPPDLTPLAVDKPVDVPPPPTSEPPPSDGKRHRHRPGAGKSGK